MDGRIALRMTVASAAICLASCGRPSEPTAPALVFSGPPALTLASASGQLNIGVWWSPAQPTVGYDATQLAITDTTGAPVTGLTLTIIPWMPAYGHGASFEPTISETMPGVYVATPLDFFMAGNWELMTAIARSTGDAGSVGADAGTGAGTSDDSVQPTVDVR